MWVWWLLGSLNKRERVALNRIAAAGGIHLPAICLWEAQMLYSKGRIKLSTPFSTWIHQATAPDVLILLPLDADTVSAGCVRLGRAW